MSKTNYSLIHKHKHGQSTYHFATAKKLDWLYANQHSLCDALLIDYEDAAGEEIEITELFVTDLDNYLNKPSRKASIFKKLAVSLLMIISCSLCSSEFQTVIPSENEVILLNLSKNKLTTIQFPESVLRIETKGNTDYILKKNHLTFDLKKDGEWTYHVFTRSHVYILRITASEDPAPAYVTIEENKDPDKLEW